RDASAAEESVARVRTAAQGSENLLPPMRAALAARCTVGEICNALREEFGTYDAHLAP
ncbi:MAG: methylmalonyl-CoA mutase family protein, partial [Gaiellaceae bacterium]